MLALVLSLPPLSLSLLRLLNSNTSQPSRRRIARRFYWNVLYCEILRSLKITAEYFRPHLAFIYTLDSSRLPALVIGAFPPIPSLLFSLSRCRLRGIVFCDVTLLCCRDDKFALNVWGFARQRYKVFSFLLKGGTQKISVGG